MLIARNILNSSVVFPIAALATTSLAALALAETAIGPSTLESPYVVPVLDEVDITAILTVGDSVNDKPESGTPYRMVGIPDGLGAFENYDGTFTVLMNHEMPGNLGIRRQHGSDGAFVSQWIVRRSDLAVLNGGDHAKEVLVWNGEGFVPADEDDSMSRLCSADLPAPSALYNRQSGNGYIGRIFLNGEEIAPSSNVPAGQPENLGGRAFAHIVSGPGAGISYELPSLGKFSWENALAPASIDLP